MAKARGLSNSSMTVFGGLPIVIVMENFYQFPPIAGRLFWGEPQTNKDHNRKTLWLSFSSVIMLTQQIRQQRDPMFVQLLKRAHEGVLN